jgi:hypothetical protein
MQFKRRILISVTLLCLQAALFSQDTGSAVDFGFGLGIGAVNLDGKVYQTMTLTPDLAIGKFGIGLDMSLRFTFTGDSGETTFSVYETDWYLNNGSFSEYLNLYLSKFDYIRWGQSGDDLYAIIGSIENATIGNGFIVGGYSNENFKPVQKYMGAQFELDGALFNWPYMGLEIMVSNISEWDIFATRLFARPIAGIDSPVFNGLEVGFSFAMDTQPFYFLNDDDDNGIYDLADSGEAFESYNTLFVTTADPDPVYVYGIDLMQPLVNLPVFQMAAMADYVIQGVNDPTMGGSVGLGGTLIKFITWKGAIIIRGNDFVPYYFNRSYDLDRSTSYVLYQNDHSDPIQDAGVDYETALGFSFLDGGISFVAQVTGPFAAPTEEALDAPWEYPHLMVLFSIGEGMIPYFDMSFWYDKQGIDSAEALVAADNALIGGRVNYRIQGAVLSLQVDVKYDPGMPNDWDVTTTLSTGIQF